MKSCDTRQLCTDGDKTFGTVHGALVVYYEKLRSFSTSSLKLLTDWAFTAFTDRVFQGATTRLLKK